jgi:hypothetical protein
MAHQMSLDFIQWHFFRVKNPYTLQTFQITQITKGIAEDISIWTLTIEEPGVDFLKSKKQLSGFRRVFRLLLNEIKFKHGQENEINIFPAAPVAIGVEVGRVCMPKADLP